MWAARFLGIIENTLDTDSFCSTYTRSIQQEVIKMKAKTKKARAPIHPVLIFCDLTKWYFIPKV